MIKAYAVGNRPQRVIFAVFRLRSDAEAYAATFNTNPANMWVTVHELGYGTNTFSFDL